MLLSRKQWTAGDKRLMVVSYDTFLPSGGSLVSETVTCPDGSVTISSVTLISNSRKVQFFLQGGTANTPFTVTVQVTDNVGQIVTDTLEFAVIAP